MVLRHGYCFPVKQPSGGGGGGTSDYNELSNRPKINGVTLSGNKTATQLELLSKDELFVFTKIKPEWFYEGTEPTTAERIALHEELLNFDFFGTSTGYKLPIVVMKYTHENPLFQHEYIAVSVKQSDEYLTNYTITFIDDEHNLLKFDTGVNYEEPDNDYLSFEVIPSSTSYNDLDDKPSINGVTLTGNKTSEDLGISEANVVVIPFSWDWVTNDEWEIPEEDQAILIEKAREITQKENPVVVWKNVQERENGADIAYFPSSHTYCYDQGDTILVESVFSATVFSDIGFENELSDYWFYATISDVEEENEVYIVTNGSFLPPMVYGADIPNIFDPDFDDYEGLAGYCQEYANLWAMCGDGFVGTFAIVTENNPIKSYLIERVVSYDVDSMSLTIKDSDQNKKATIDVTLEWDEEGTSCTITDIELTVTELVPTETWTFTVNGETVTKKVAVFSD